jgi:hypothetical protein
MSGKKATSPLRSCKSFFKVDIDYENRLFQTDYDEKEYIKIVRDWEYVFFLCNEDPLAGLMNSKKVYDPKYLTKLKHMGFVVGDLDPNASNFSYFWGHNDLDWNLQRKLNSKITSAQIASQNGWGFWKGSIVYSFEDIKSHALKHSDVDRWLLRKPHGSSGVGQKYFSADAFDAQLLNKFIGSSLWHV